jgi:hypothetical protein
MALVFMGSSASPSTLAAASRAPEESPTAGVLKKLRGGRGFGFAGECTQHRRSVGGILLVTREVTNVVILLPKSYDASLVFTYSYVRYEEVQA